MNNISRNLLFIFNINLLNVYFEIYIGKYSKFLWYLKHTFLDGIDANNDNDNIDNWKELIVKYKHKLLKEKKNDDGKNFRRTIIDANKKIIQINFC